MSEDFDFSGEAPVVNTNALEMLPTMAATLREKLAAVTRAEDDLAEAQRDLAHFQMVVIPEAMQLAGVAEFSLKDGTKLFVKDDIKASITKDNAGYAYAWLRQNNHGAVIKTAYVVDLRALTDKQREELRKWINDEYEIVPEQTESVHPSTLKSLVKELLEGGTTLPPSISVFQFKKAELKEPKGRK